MYVCLCAREREGVRRRRMRRRRGRVEGDGGCALMFLFFVFVYTVVIIVLWYNSWKTYMGRPLITLTTFPNLLQPMSVDNHVCNLCTSCTRAVQGNLSVRLVNRFLMYQQWSRELNSTYLCIFKCVHNVKNVTVRCMHFCMSQQNIICLIYASIN